VKSESEVGKTSYVSVRENLDSDTRCSPVTTLCRFQYGVAGVSYAIYTEYRLCFALSL